MIRVTVKNPWYGREYTQDLADALTPTIDHDGGIAERALENSEGLARVVGSLLATLVERRVLTLDDAKHVAGVRDEIRIIE
ncbi:hypothetical protein [Caulobacter phage KcrB]|nr:hypothetical protein RW_GP039 [Caulobacter phage RW]WCA46343.1 hypothetical protein [Caulobacter phage KcrB]WCD56278.1 hypothetical protein [Caulobacter phage RLK]WNV48070.1 hypothetical protein GB2A_gp038 [Caulobacter phage GB2A]